MDCSKEVDVLEMAVTGVWRDKEADWVPFYCPVLEEPEVGRLGG